VDKFGFLVRYWSGYPLIVIPAKVGIQRVRLISSGNNQLNKLDSRLRGNDG